MTTRREFLKTSGGVILAGTGQIIPASVIGAIAGMPAELPEGTLESAALEALPGKVALIKRSYRPPNFETPLAYFREAFTPNNAFFVRYHLAGIPEVNAGNGASRSVGRRRRVRTS